MEWQPIETAPKDGTEILLFGSCNWSMPTRKNDPVPIVGSWDEFGGSECEGGWVTLTFNPYTDDCDATHWMPLPKPPEVSK